MNQTLISPCPNCGFDATKHNKILYDGIFLICHNCNYGWYYNIEIFKPNKPVNFANNSIPIRTLDSNYNNSYSPYYRNKSQLKNKKKYLKSTSPHKKSDFKKNIETIKNNKTNTFLNSKDKNTNLGKRAYSNSSEKKYSQYNNESNYSDNIYYESNINNSPYQKKQSYNINNLNTKHAKPLTNKYNLIKLDNILNPSSLNNISNTLENKSVSLSKAQQTINTTSKNKVKNKVPATTHINSLNEGSNIKIKSNIVSSEYLKKSQKDPSPSNRIPSNIIPESNIDIKNNYISNNIKKLSNNSQIPYVSNDSKNIENFSDKNEKTTGKTLNADKHNKTLNSSQLYNKLNNTETVDTIIKPSSDVNFQKNLPKTSLKEDSQDNLYAFNTTPVRNISREIENTLINKSNLGLNNINLLKFEEQANYNIAHFKVPLIDIPQLIKSFIDFIKKSIHNIFNFPKLIFTIFTRLDLFLKTFAYLFILIGAISFLSYSYYKKQNNIKSSNLKNTECKNKSLIENNKKLAFQNDNFSLSNKADNNIINSHSLSKETIAVVDEQPEEKIIAFEKESTINNFENPKTIKDININKLATQNNERLSFLTKIRTTINNSLISLKQIKINTFNKVKIYNDGFSLQGDYNNILVTHAILSNEDYKNSYLIRSLEVIFLEKSGKNIGKRIIIANQFVNVKSAISINLKINNPPKNISKIVIFIKDKKQL